MSVNVNASLNKMNVNELKEYISKQGKLVNQNLSRLEKQGISDSSHAYKYIEQKCYDAGVNKVKTNLYKSNKVGYNLSTKGLTRNELLNKAREIQLTRTSKTITKTGIVKSYKKMEKNFNKLGLNLGYSDIGKLFELFRGSNLGVNFGSDQIVDLSIKSVNANLTVNDIRDLLNNLPENASIKDFKDLTNNYIHNTLNINSDVDIDDFRKVDNDYTLPFK